MLTVLFRQNGIKALVNGILKVVGVRLVNSGWGPRGHAASIARLLARGFKPSLIVDVGAASGTWTIEFLKIFPQSRFLLIDPLPENVEVLTKLSQQYDQLSVFIGVAGSENGAVDLIASGDQSSVFSGSEFKGNSITVQQRRLEELIDELEVDGSILLKLDVQGAEIKVLEGATSALGRCEAILIELSITPLYDEAPLAGEVIASLHQMGFDLFDICSYAQRPRDGQLSQSDMLFIKRGSALMGAPGWS